jgi:hypothetical protein
VHGNPVNLHDPSGTAGLPTPEPIIKSGGSNLIGDFAGWSTRWEQAAEKVLSKKFGTSSLKEGLQKFESHIEILKSTVGPGSNRQKGTAINVARETYKAVRQEFGVLMKAAGVDVQGVQLHHFFGGVAKLPEKALDATGLGVLTGQAGVKGTEHNLAHAAEDALAPEVKQLFAEVDSRKLAAVTKETTTEATKLIGLEGKEALSITAKTGGKEVLQVAEKTGLKEGAKILGTKAAKFVPFVGIGVGVGLVANDLHKGDYTSAAWDAAEAIPVVGDVVGAGHLGITAGGALNEGLGIDTVAAEHGMAVQAAAKSLGLGQDASLYVGAAGAAISSITVAPGIALRRTMVGWLK